MILTSSTVEMDRMQLITSGLQEVIGLEKLETLLENKPDLTAYWGTAPTGQIHIGYLIPLLKIKDLTTANIKVKILIADVHSLMDANKTPIEKLTSRKIYYQIVLEKVLQYLKVDMSMIEFVIGSDHQKTPEYMFDLFRLASVSNVSNCVKAGSEVVKQTKDPLMSSAMYPMLQALDEVYLNVDIELGGIDQRKIFTYACDFLPRIGYKHVVYLMNPMMCSINTVNINEPNKMSASDINSKINLLDKEKVIRNKINKMPYVENQFSTSSIYQLLTLVLFKMNSSFTVGREEKYGGTVVYSDVLTIESDLLSDKLNIGDLKRSIGDFFVAFSKEISSAFIGKEDIISSAYN